MNILEMDFGRILKTHYFIVTLASLPSALDLEWSIYLRPFLKITIMYRLLVSVRLWNFKDGGSYNTRFLPKNKNAQRIFFLKQIYNELLFAKKCQNCTFKVNFLCLKSTKFFQKKNHLRISI